MSNSSLNVAVDEVPPAAPEGNASAGTSSASGSSSKSSVSGGAAKAGSAPVAAGKPIRSGGSMGLPFIVVVLICAAAGVGIFGLTEFQAAGQLRGEVAVLRTEVTELNATVATLQSENNHFEGVLTRVRAATGSLQASLAELNELAGTTP